MNIEDELKEILNSAYDDVVSERIQIEMNDFKKMEEFMSRAGDPVESGETELWYMSMSEHEGLDAINEGEGGVKALSVLYKCSYGDVYDALSDKELIRECKEDNCVGIITRSEAWASVLSRTQNIKPSEADDRKTVSLTTLTTPNGVHIISRSGNELATSSYSRHKITRGESKLVDALVDACFGW
jgi:Asp/Glu/hydantoin racemase